MDINFCMGQVDCRGINERGALYRLVRKTGGSLADDGLKVCR